MTLRHTTLANAANRKRFVTEEASFPYIRFRERQNARRHFRETLHAIDEVLRTRSVYGTGNAQEMALRLALLVGRLEHFAAKLKDLPTVAELKAAAARRERLIQWRAKFTPEATATETVTDRLAAD